MFGPTLYRRCLVFLSGCLRENASAMQEQASAMPVIQPGRQVRVVQVPDWAAKDSSPPPIRRFPNPTWSRGPHFHPLIQLSQSISHGRPEPVVAVTVPESELAC